MASLLQAPGGVRRGVPGVEPRRRASSRCSRCRSTRATSRSARLGYAETLLTAIILVSILAALRDRRGVRALLVRRRRRRAPRAPRPHHDRRSSSSRRPRRGSSRSCSPGRSAGCSSGSTTRRSCALRRPRPVGVHEPRDRLRAAARRGAPPDVRASRRVTNVAAHRGADRHARRRASTRARRGYVLGNYAASTVVLFGLWSSPCAATSRSRRGCASAARLARPMLRFGSPTVPADAAVFALNVIDRAYILRADSPAAAGLYARGGQARDGVVIFAVRGFQLRLAAARLLARRTTTEAGRVYALVTTAYVLFDRPRGRGLRRCSGAGSCACSRRRRSTPPTRRCRGSRSAGRSTGCSSSSSTIAGRAKVTTRTLPGRAAAGLVVNVVGCSSSLVGAARHRGRRDRAVRAPTS